MASIVRERWAELVGHVRNPIEYSSFSPGGKFWIVKHNSNSRKEYPTAVTIGEQLGLKGEDDFTKGISVQKFDNIPHKLNGARINKYGTGNTYFITVTVDADDEEEYGDDTSSPNKSLMNIVHSDRHKIAVERLKNKTCGIDGIGITVATRSAQCKTVPPSPAPVRKIFSPSPAKKEAVVTPEDPKEGIGGKELSKELELEATATASNITTARSFTT